MKLVFTQPMVYVKQFMCLDLYTLLLIKYLYILELSCVFGFTEFDLHTVNIRNTNQNMAAFKCINYHLQFSWEAFCA